MEFKLGDTVNVDRALGFGLDSHSEGLINNKGFIFYISNTDVPYEVKGNINKDRIVWRFEKESLTHTKLLLLERFYEFKSLTGDERGTKKRAYEHSTVQLL